MLRHGSRGSRPLASALVPRLRGWLALVWLVCACGDDRITDPLAGIPASLEIVSGNEQEVVVGSELPQPLVVRVLDHEGRPIADQIINFRVLQGGGSVFAGAALTNAQGIARERWTLGTTAADSQVVEARAVDAASGTALVFGRFVATALPGAPSRAEIVRGDAQSARVGTVLPDSLVVRVVDSYGNPLSGVPVAWSVSAGGGSLSEASRTTTSDGLAGVVWTLDSVAGSHTVEAIVGDDVAAAFAATATVEPAILSKRAGDEQIALPGTAVARPPSVTVADSARSVKAGVTIHFAVTGGGGSITGAVAVSDENGVAAVGSWTLGTEPGENTLTATSPSGDMVTFRAVGGELPPPVLAKYEGDNQVADPGGPVAVPPAVLVTGDDGTPRPGATVTFAVTAGGGSVTGATAVSDASGIARVGGWTLGPATGLNNALTASVPNSAAVTFTATAARSTPDIGIQILEPTSELVGDTVVVRASIGSNYQLASVTAHMGGQTVSLGVPTSGAWQGTVVLTGVPRDTVTLVVRATDIHGAVEEAVRRYTHDRKPRLIVTSPSESSVARPDVLIDAACDDDAPGCTLTVRESGRLIAGPSPSPLHVTVALDEDYVRERTISIEATDSRGQITYAPRTLFVESSTRLELIGAGAGRALDVRDSRLLFHHTTASDTVAIIRHLGSERADTVRFSGSMERAFLTPNGVAFTSYTSRPVSSVLYVLRDRSVLTRSLNSTWLAASGDFIVYTLAPIVYGPLYRMNVVSGVEERIAESATNTDYDVAANGDVVFSTSSNVVRYRGTTATQITNDDGTTWVNTSPLTDGVNVVFLRRAPCCSDRSPVEIWLYDGAALTRLASGSYDFRIGQYVSPGSDYAVNSGWTAFTRLDAVGHTQVWTRSPGGEQRAVSAFGSSSKIRALGADGSVVFDNANGRYLAGPSSAPVRVSSTLGVVRWRDGRFVTFIGNSAFAIVP